MIKNSFIYKMKKTAIALGISLVFFFMTIGCNHHPEIHEIETVNETEIHDFSGEMVIKLNNNIPESDLFELMRDESFEFYSPLDEFGRCGSCYANLSKELMPEEERGKIGHIKPTGWHTVKYPDIIPDDLYLYNRCHLIGFQLSGENDNPLNLITGTRYMNTRGMLPYENRVSRYIYETNHHVYYRVTPVYEGNDLVAKGVQMEAYSVEDQGVGVCFNVFLYNVQPGIRIDYSTGESKEDASVQITNKNAGNASDYDYILNIKSGKFHYGDCNGVSEMKEYNKEFFKGTREEVLELGYKPCGSCHP